eukprot:CAMPEP_0170160136 /NCGR_PEP_ID=MMETSP0033_2-20121228/72703_1 /TAXON_ID=195969 /ORGANISM="Dolichomastix tenuilepis, Strain CCMP3274" /LENGTH=30 /DNA_ID= /DNA_START= /DNA_END= /DNA_ORIENTATION=
MAAAPAGVRGGGACSGAVAGSLEPWVRALP